METNVATKRRTISRTDFNSLIRKHAIDHGLPIGQVRSAMIDIAIREGFEIVDEEITLIEKIRYAQVEAGEQVVVAHLQQFEQGLKPSGPPLVEQVKQARVNAGEQTVIAFLKEKGLA